MWRSSVGWAGANNQTTKKAKAQENQVFILLSIRVGNLNSNEMAAVKARKRLSIAPALRVLQDSDEETEK
jgi:hypothetical protein